jgi:hypothetical protein
MQEKEAHWFSKKGIVLDLVTGSPLEWSFLEVG